MMFDKLLDVLNENGKGLHGYNKVAETARVCMESDPERAAGYLLLAIQAERFIENTGRLAVTAGQTESVFTEFEKNTTTLKTSYGSGNPVKILAALNDVSLAVF
jgi:hypothetical protein